MAPSLGIASLTFMCLRVCVCACVYITTSDVFLFWSPFRIAVSVRGDWSDAVGNYESKQKMCCNAPGTPAAYSTQMKLKLDDPDVRFEIPSLWSS